MFCNNFINGAVEQPGEQPIRVFFNLIKNDFEGIREELARQKPNAQIENVQFEFLSETIPLIGPSTNGKKISIHDTYLSFLWGYIYGSFTLTPMAGKILSDEENKRAREVRKYAKGLMNNYEEWDKNKLPNPELCGRDEKRLIGNTNMVFIHSVQFVLLHEFSHIYLDHPNVPLEFRTIDNIRKMEIDADLLATKWAIQNFTSENKFSSQIALISTLNSLSYAKYKFGDPGTHQPAEDRITACLEILNPNDNDYLWGYALYSILEWQTDFELFYIPAFEIQQGYNFKQLFYAMIKELKEYKETGVAKLKIPPK